MTFHPQNRFSLQHSHVNACSLGLLYMQEDLDSSSAVKTAPKMKQNMSEQIILSGLLCNFIAPFSSTGCVCNRAVKRKFSQVEFGRNPNIAIVNNSMLNLLITLSSIDLCVVSDVFCPKQRQRKLSNRRSLSIKVCIRLP